MEYITDNKISDTEDVDFRYLENTLCPGQTIGSIKRFVRSLTTKKHTGKVEGPPTERNVHNEPLYEVCLHKLKCPRTAGNRKSKSKKKHQRIKEIVDIYNKLIEKIQ